MKFKLKKASDWGFEDNIEINTLDQLLQFIENAYEKYKNEHFGQIDGIVLSKEGDEWQIQIYDDYLE